MAVQLIITFEIKKEKLEGFLNLLEDVKIKLPEIEGCNEVKIFQKKEKQHHITLVESWESKKIHQAHIQTVVDSGDWEFIASHLVTSPISDYYQQL